MVIPAGEGVSEMENIQWTQVIVSVLLALISSTGLWSYISTRRDKKDAKTKMLVGLAHDRITYLGVSYINRGYVTADEYENLYEYLYKPYEQLGGNGSAKRIMESVKKLPLQK